MPKKELEELLRETLSIHPLEDILKIQFIGVKRKFINEDRLKKKVDVLAIIGPEVKPRHEEGIVYSWKNPLILAHEIGHFLGLRHPERLCTTFCSYTEPLCKKRYTDIMCCYPLRNLGEVKRNFSEEDLQKLNDTYLRS